jgi:hypothetical protein
MSMRFVLRFTLCFSLGCSSSSHLSNLGGSGAGDGGGAHDAPASSATGDSRGSDGGRVQMTGDGEAAGTMLPTCHWPANLAPTIPDGAVASSIPSRAYLACGMVVSGSYDAGGSQFCWSDSGTICTPPTSGPSAGGAFTPCQMACQPSEYAVTSIAPPVPGDADVVEIALPSGCTDPVAGFPEAVTSAGSPRVHCCPCE